MKNLKFSLILLFPICAFAQWTPSPYTSGNISFLTGNVGIGKTANNNKLVVLGTTSLEGSLLISNSFSLSRNNISGFGYTTLFQAYGSNTSTGDNIRIEAASNVYAGHLELRGGYSEFGWGGNVRILGGEGISADDWIDVQGITESQGGDVEIKGGNSMLNPGNVFINAGNGGGYNGSAAMRGNIYLAQNGGIVGIGGGGIGSNQPSTNVNLTNGNLIIGADNSAYNFFNFKSKGKSYIQSDTLYFKVKKFGIGTEKPTAALEIKSIDNLGFKLSSSTRMRISSPYVDYEMYSVGTKFKLVYYTSSGVETDIFSADGKKIGIGNSELRFKDVNEFGISSLNDGKWHFSYQLNEITKSDLLVITADGKIGMGTDSPDSKLTVKGNIHTQEVKVDLNGAVAPDYVFDKNYDLKPLAEVEKYIEQNKHLPEVPSGTEMDQNGVNLKEMNLLLLKKIEELTLHLIEQDKAIRKLSTEVNKLKGDQ